MSFDTLGLAPEFLRAVADQGYTVPTPVQAEAIPLVLAGRDVLGWRPDRHRQDGRLRAADAPEPAASPRRSADRPARIRALVLAPTRELALAGRGERPRPTVDHSAVRSTAIYGGVGINAPGRRARAGADIVVATPGRLLDPMEPAATIDLAARRDPRPRRGRPDARHGLHPRHPQGRSRCSPQAPEPALQRDVLRRDPPARRARFLHDPATVAGHAPATPPSRSSRSSIRVDRERKRELLTHLIKTGVVDQALVFTRTKHGANRLAQQLERDGIGAAAIHGNKSQGAARARARRLQGGKHARSSSRPTSRPAGSTSTQLPHVVNFELPMVPDDYVHRIGRTGRAGSPGHAVSLVCVDEHKLLREIEQILGAPIPQEVISGFEPDRSIRAGADPARRSGHVPAAGWPRWWSRTRPGPWRRSGPWRRALPWCARLRRGSARPSPDRSSGRAAHPATRGRRLQHVAARTEPTGTGPSGTGPTGTGTTSTGPTRPTTGSTASRAEPGPAAVDPAGTTGRPPGCAPRSAARRTTAGWRFATVQRPPPRRWPAAEPRATAEPWRTATGSHGRRRAPHRPPRRAHRPGERPGLSPGRPDRQVAGCAVRVPRMWSSAVASRSAATTTATRPATSGTSGVESSLTTIPTYAQTMTAP